MDTEVLSIGVKQRKHENDHSPPSCAEVKKRMHGTLSPLSHTSSWYSA
jgi:hypothetical protein